MTTHQRSLTARFRIVIHSPVDHWGFNGVAWGAKAAEMEHSEAMRSFFLNRLSGNFRSIENTMAMEAGKNTGGNGNAIKVRTIFISDMHLGTRSCRAELILSFLRKYDAETLYLIGDIIDGWRLKNSWYWPELHDEVLRVIMGKVTKGSRVVYIPGNHDDFLRLSGGKKPARVEMTDTAIHTTADGKRFLVMHGDQLDEVIRNIPWLAHLGDLAYDLLTALNRAYNKVTGLFGLEYRSIAALVKASVKCIVNFIGKFEEALVTAGRDNNVDGVICGHIHHAVIRNIENMCYVNTGDWVENCTAIVENVSGTLELVHHRVH
jgi:UDP-2,3-diacylglucosamine pyrophosphatase LpxH